MSFQSDSAPASAVSARSNSSSRNAKLAAAAIATAFACSASSTALAAWDPVEKSITDLRSAYTAGTTNVTEVAQAYVNRINQYNSFRDIPGVGYRIGLNAIAELNPNWQAEAAAIQAKIDSGATFAQYPLLGVPVIVKNSYDAVGMATNNGVSILNKAVSGVNTPGSTTLRPTVDAFSVAQLRASGALILGKAGQTTMAYAYDGIDNSIGQIRNPYNPNRWPGGSSSGTGSGIAANLAMLGMGGETGGSIRVPANANALVGLKTSAGIIDPGGTWPLTPSRDVVGPLAKTVTDVAISMNALVGPSSKNLWNNTPFYPTGTPQPGTVRPTDYTAGLSTTALVGKVIAVPKSMAGITSGTPTTEGSINSTVLSTFNTALNTIRAQGATVIYVDIPASTTYYSTIGKAGTTATVTGPPSSTVTTGGATVTGFPFPYPSTTVTDSIVSGGVVTGTTTRLAPDNTWSGWAASYYYNELIKSYNDPVIKDLNDFANALKNAVNAGGAGSPLGSLGSTSSTNATGYTGATNNVIVLANTLNAGNAKGFGDADNNGIPDNPDAIKALQAFSDLRKTQYEAFMASPSLPDDPSTPSIDESTITKIDAFAAPTYGTVMATVPVSQRIAGVPLGTYTGGTASLLGRFESNILGAPSLSVPMGYFPDGTPMGLQFFAEFLSEEKLLGLAYDYEQATLWRTAPNLALLQVVPEPTTLMVLSGAALVALRRRGRREVATV